MSVIQGPWTPRGAANGPSDAEILAAFHEATRQAERIAANPPAAPWRGLPFDAIDAVAACFADEEGRGEHWRVSDECDLPALLWSARFHLDKYENGEKLDIFSGRSHLAHAATALLMALSRFELMNGEMEE